MGYTKGDWKVCEYDKRLVQIDGNGGRLTRFGIADCANTGLPATEELANARLIAAAPKIYEAAKDFVTELSESVLEELRYTWGETNFQVVKAKRWLLLQAIAKVEGINE